MENENGKNGSLVKEKQKVPDLKTTGWSNPQSTTKSFLTNCGLKAALLL